MARSTPGVTRRRIVDEAIRQFASRGYNATSVAEIQVACGLTAGSGALYKHFASKEELLRHAVHQHLEEIAQSFETAVGRVPEDPREALDLLATSVWEVIDRDRDLIRLMLRDFDAFPDVFEAMWAGVPAQLYRGVTRWIKSQHKLGMVDVGDPDATAAVLVASLTYFPILKILIGHTPGDLGARRFRTAWIEHATRTLGIES
jgi:AcrR family transcriptional regulator